MRTVVGSTGSRGTAPGLHVWLLPALEHPSRVWGPLFPLFSSGSLLSQGGLFQGGIWGVEGDGDGALDSGCHPAVLLWQLLCIVEQQACGTWAAEMNHGIEYV